MAGHALVKLKRELLAKLGRSYDALESAWAEFRGVPSTFSYGELMRFRAEGQARGVAREGRTPSSRTSATTGPSPPPRASRSRPRTWRPRSTVRWACAS
jgi:hypothetical protein